MQIATEDHYLTHSRPEPRSVQEGAQGFCPRMGQLLQNLCHESIRERDRRVVAQTNQTDLLEAVEEGPDEVCGTKETWCKRRKGLGVGQYAQVVLAHSEQLDTFNHAE